MPIETSAPAQAQENPFLPPGTSPLIAEMFGGVNTAATRAGVADEQVYWLDGFFPQAPRNARAMYGSGTAIYTAAGKTVVWFGFANIGSTPYCIIFQSDGSVIAVNTTTTATTTILAAATITSPTMLNCGMTQWGSQYVIIVADQTNGYWLWDGATVYKAGTLNPVLTVTATGGGYTSSTPTLVITGGHGSGASANVSISNGMVVSASIVNPGTGYLVDDTVLFNVVPLPTGGSGATLAVAATVATSGGFALTSITVTSGGSLYTNPTIVVTGGFSGYPVTTARATVLNGTITSVSITFTGFFANGASPSITAVDTGVAATITGGLMPFGVQGTCVETYSGHVWVGKQATIYYTAPGSFSNFSTASGGGNFTSNDSFLKVGFTRLVQTNGFLYLVADSSVNYISGVQTAGSPPTTTFTNQNADPEVGSPYPQSVILQGQNVMFANANGVYTLNGSRATKVSDFVDNVYNSVANFGGLQLSGATATIFGRKVWMELVDIVDPVTGVTAQKLLMWDGKRWWASAQDIAMTYVKHQIINSVITAYGTDGTVVSPLFSTASTGFQKTIQTKYFDAPGGPLLNKTANRFFGIFDYYSAAASTNLTLSIDGVGVATSGQFTNSNTYTITGPTVTGYFVTPPEAVGQQGVLNGFTLKTSAADMSVIFMALIPTVTQYRG